MFCFVYYFLLLASILTSLHLSLSFSPVRVCNLPLSDLNLLSRYQSPQRPARIKYPPHTLATALLRSAAHKGRAPLNKRQRRKLQTFNRKYIYTLLPLYKWSAAFCQLPVPPGVLNREWIWMVHVQTWWVCEILCSDRLRACVFTTSNYHFCFKFPFCLMFWFVAFRHAHQIEPIRGVPFATFRLLV